MCGWEVLKSKNLRTEGLAQWQTAQLTFTEPEFQLKHHRHSKINLPFQWNELLKLLVTNRFYNKIERVKNVYMAEFWFCACSPSSPTKLVFLWSDWKCFLIPTDGLLIFGTFLLTEALICMTFMQYNHCDFCVVSYRKKAQRCWSSWVMPLLSETAVKISLWSRGF